MAHRNQSARWLFTERRLTVLSLGVVLGSAVQFVPGLMKWLFGGPSPWHSATCIDFTWLWVASKFAASVAPAHAYDYPTFLAAKRALVGVPDCILEPVDYPPTLFFYVYPLHALSYEVAFVAWLAISAAVYLAVVYAIVPHRAALIAALAPAPVWVNVWLGHGAFLTAGFMGFALVFSESRPWLAAVPLALLTYKPQFGILVPPALAVSRRWKALIAAALASVVFACLAGAFFGFETWPAFVQSLAARASQLHNDPAAVRYLVSLPFIMSRGSSGLTVWTLQLALTLGAATSICLIWAKPSVPYALKAAAIAFGSVLASPHVFPYDLCILTIGGLFLVKDGLNRGFTRGEQMFVLACWLLLYSLWISAWPVPLLVCFAMFGLTALRALRCFSEGMQVPRAVRARPI